ncbi:SRPBCC family protein [Amycolatopsis nigrescens]|uniref:SRPBCC family protein n=1 Tax=Amycolatopsis nigrescens TaxID=381445 RepID=UPI00037E2F36|nr:SRPBCC family protein [Amycolatopsis nigrescens]
MAGHTEASILIDAPFQLVWDMTNDVDNWTNLFTEYAEAKVIEREGNTVKFRLALHPDENGKVWSWVSQRTFDVEKREVHAKRVETGPFEYMHIYWKYTEEDGKVRMTWKQDFHMKPAAPLDDDGMTNRINTNTPIQMNVIKERVEAAARTSAASR